MAYDNLVQWKIDLYTYLYVFVYVYSFVHTVTKSQFFWFTLELLVKNFFPHFKLYFDTFRSKSIQKEEMKFSRLQLAINKIIEKKKRNILSWKEVFVLFTSSLPRIRRIMGRSWLRKTIYLFMNETHHLSITKKNDPRIEEAFLPANLSWLANN